MSEPVIRPMASGDDLALNEILGDPQSIAQASGRALLRPDHEDPVLVSVVAVDAVAGDGAGGDAGVVVGAAAISESRLHPGRAWVHVEVAATERRRGIGASLLEAVRRRAAETPLGDIALRARVAVARNDGAVNDGAGEEGAANDEAVNDGAGENGDSAGREFARAAGFREAMRTRIVRVEAAAMRMPELENREDDAAITVTSTGSVALTQAFGEWYRRIHADWDPAAELSVGAVNKAFLSEDAGAFGAALVKRGPVVTGFAVSYAQPEAEAETGLTLGLANRGTAEELKMLIGVLAAEHPVVIESTSAMPELESLLDGLIGRGVATIRDEYHTVVAD